MKEQEYETTFLDIIIVILFYILLLPAVLIVSIIYLIDKWTTPKKKYDDVEIIWNMPCDWKYFETVNNKKKTKRKTKKR